MSDALLTGRGSGYRGVAIRCSGCGEAMRQLALSEAEVDVCDACGGLWVDWFDGEVRAITTETLQSKEPPGQAAAVRNEVIATGACPRCTRQLVPERYEVKAENPSARVEGRTSTVTATTGAELLRCEDCMGAFVTRSAAEVLSWLSESEEAPRSRSDMKALPWDRFLALLKRIFGAG